MTRDRLVFPRPAGVPFQAPPPLPHEGRLRPATTADMGFLRRLYRSLRSDELAATGWPEAAKAAFCDNQFACQHRDWTGRYPGAFFLVLTCRRQPIGRFYLRLERDWTHVIDIGLLPEWRGRGLGSALLDAAQRLAASGGRGVRLHVLHGNLRARALYRRLGFVEDGAAQSHHLSMVWPPSGQDAFSGGAPGQR